MLNTVLERLTENVLPFPYASDGRVNGLFSHARKVEKNTALNMALLQINGPRCIRYLCFDVDRPLAALAWEDANLPIPNLILINPKNGHAHLIWELCKPIFLRKKGDKRPGDAAPIRFLRAVQKAMGEALNADTAYNGLLVKNPFHASWVQKIGCTKPYTLSELSRHLELYSPAPAILRDNWDGRNSTLFDSIRLWAYRAKSRFSNFYSFSDCLAAELDRLNGELTEHHRGSLPQRELHYIHKSVVDWVWNNYTGNGKAKRRGVMQLDPTEDLRSRQQKGQVYTSGILVGKTVALIGSTIRQLAVEGVRVTISEVHRRSKLSRNTVARYWSRFTDSLTPITEEETVSLRDESSNSLRSQGASPEQLDTLIPTRMSSNTVFTFDEVKDMCQNSKNAHLEAIRYAIEQAKQGIIVAGVPKTLEKAILQTVDKWRQQESSVYYEQRTTQRST